MPLNYGEFILIGLTTFWDFSSDEYRFSEYPGDIITETGLILDSAALIPKNSLKLNEALLSIFLFCSLLKVKLTFEFFRIVLFES